MSSKLTVSRLRDELEKRGLDTTGLKPVLASRLDEAIAEEEAASKDGHKDGANGEKRKRSSDSPPSEEERKNTKRLKVEDVGGMTAKELKEALSQRDLSTSGKKGELVERLTDAVEAEAKASKPVVDGKVDGKVDEEEDESIKVEDLSTMNVKEIKEALSTRGLSTSGKKSDLIDRLTEALESKNGASTDKNATKDDQDAKVVVLKKGRAVLDQYIDDRIKNSYHVYEGKLYNQMEVFDAMLNQTNVGGNNNKFYVLQILEADSGKNYYVFLRWGRVGVKGQQKLFGPMGDVSAAIAEFQTKFYEKTKNHWHERHQFVAYPNKYTWIEMDYEEDSDKKPMDQDSKDEKVELKKPVAVKPSKLDWRVKEFVDLVCNVSMMQQQMMEIGYDARKMPLGKLSKSTILKGYEVLKRLAAALDDKSTSSKREIQELSSEFYTVIPHDFGFKHMSQFIIDTVQKLKKKLEMVEALGEIEVATKLLVNDTPEDEDPAYTHYKRLNCELQPLDTASEEFELIKQYVEKTHGQTHSGYKLELLNVFKLQREGESDRFQSFEKTPNRMLLWHGSRLSNWTGILSQGLRIAPPEAPVTGYMFGKGVYFADMVSKSANYCCTSPSDPVGVLLLSEVALGNMNELFHADYNANDLPIGKLSTKGVGRTVPDPKEFKTLEDGVVVPVGSPVPSNQQQASLMYNEYIVYDVSQIRMRYLLQVRFNYGSRRKY